MGNSGYVKSLVRSGGLTEGRWRLSNAIYHHPLNPKATVVANSAPLCITTMCSPPPAQVVRQQPAKHMPNNRTVFLMQPKWEPSHGDETLATAQVIQQMGPARRAAFT